MLKKTMMVGMAVGVAAALALPTVASATWRHHSTAIQQDVQIGLTGKFKTDAALVGVECQVTTRVKFLANQTTGTVETFVPHPTSDTANCVGMGGYAFCQIHNMNPQGLPWTLHTAAWQTTQLSGQQKVGGAQHQTAITITTQSVTFQLTGAFCSGGPLLVNYKPTTIGAVCVPANCQTLTGFQMNGIVPVELITNGGGGPTHLNESTFTGSLEIESPNGSTYSI